MGYQMRPSSGASLLRCNTRQPPPPLPLTTISTHWLSSRPLTPSLGPVAPPPTPARTMQKPRSPFPFVHATLLGLAFPISNWIIILGVRTGRDTEDDRQGPCTCVLRSLSCLAGLACLLPHSSACIFILRLRQQQQQEEVVVPFFFFALNYGCACLSLPYHARLPANVPSVWRGGGP